MVALQPTSFSETNLDQILLTSSHAETLKSVHTLATLDLFTGELRFYVHLTACFNLIHLVKTLKMGPNGQMFKNFEVSTVRIFQYSQQHRNDKSNK